VPNRGPSRDVEGLPGERGASSSAASVIDRTGRLNPAARSSTPTPARTSRRAAWSGQRPGPTSSCSRV